MIVKFTPVRCCSCINKTDCFRNFWMTFTDFHTGFCLADSYLGKSQLFFFVFNAERKPFDLITSVFFKSFNQSLLYFSAVNCLGVYMSECVYVYVYTTHTLCTVCAVADWVLHSYTAHFPFAFLLSSIISTTDKLFNKFDSKKCLNASVMAVLTTTPSLGPNLCYWPAEDELSTGEKNQRVWNGKWYTTVAYRGNLYYKLPQCTVAEPQIALSFSACMSLYTWACMCVCATWRVFFVFVSGSV